MQFAAGQMVNALGVMIACHLEHCSHCRQRIRVYEQIGGELMEEITPQEASPGLFSEVLSRIDNNTGAAASSDQTDNRIILPDVPRPLQRFVDAPYEELQWKGLTSSIRHYDLPFSDSRYSARFYRISAGKELPQHTHKGHEFTLVMSGSFSDRAGSYHPGDFVLADTSTHHQPRAHDDKDCICFAVTDAPLKMTGFFGRMLNPFLS